MGLSEEILIDDIVNQCDEEELIEPRMDIFSVANPKSTECRQIDEPCISNLQGDEYEIDEIESSEYDIVIDLIDLECDDRPGFRMILRLGKCSMKCDKDEEYSENSNHTFENIEDISPKKYRIKEIRKELLENHIWRDEEGDDDGTEKQEYPKSIEYDPALFPPCYHLSCTIHEISTSSPHLIEDGPEDIGYNSKIIERDPGELLEWIPHEDKEKEIDTEKKNWKHKSKKSVSEEGKPAREYEWESCEKKRMFPWVQCMRLDISIDWLPWAIEEYYDKNHLTNNDTHTREESSRVNEWCVDQDCEGNEEKEKHRQIIISMIL